MIKALTPCALLLFLSTAAVAQDPPDPAAPPRVRDPQGAPASESTEAPDVADAAGKDAAAGSGAATSSPSSGSEGQVKVLSGMSILGNKEAPKSLVIVPWKSSELGAELGVSRALDTSIRPVDKDVFMRELEYYELRESDGS
jgi:hypothetical protein